MMEDLIQGSKDLRSVPATPGCEAEDAVKHGLSIAGQFRAGVQGFRKHLVCALGSKTQAPTINVSS